MYRLFLLGVLISMTGTLLGQSSVDEARKAKPVKKASRVITDDDMPSRPNMQSQIDNSEADKTPDAGVTQKDESQYKDAVPSTEKGTDGSSAEGERARLNELDSDERNLSQGIEDLKVAIDKEEDPSRRDVLQDMMKGRQKSLTRATAERKELQAQMAAQKDKSEKKPVE